MAIQPTQPAPSNRLGKALTIGGAVVGGVYGGPQGAMAGAGAGQMAGGLLQQQPEAPIESQGMARRRETLSQDPFMAIREAQAALQSLPPDQLPETRKAFENAMLIAQRNQQMGAGRLS